MSHEALDEALTMTPALTQNAYTQPGTGNRYLGVFAPAGTLTVRYAASVDLQLVQADADLIQEIPIQEVPLSCFEYLLPSRYCPSDKLENFVERHFGDLPPGHNRVTAICNWIYDHVDYQRGSSDAATTALDAFIRRAGVCRDFAHMGVAFCRALGIPARFVSCYAYGLVPADFHAVFEAYLGGHWWLFDPTRQAALDGIVRIGVGRDAADVSFATIYGQAEQTGMRVWMEPASPGYVRTLSTAAVRTA